MENKPKEIRFRDKVFRSIAEFRRLLKISPSSLQNQRRKGKSFEEIYDMYSAEGYIPKNKKPVAFRGLSFDSLSDFARYIGGKKQTVYNMTENGRSLEEVYRKVKTRDFRIVGDLAEMFSEDEFSMAWE